MKPIIMVLILFLFCSCDRKTQASNNSIITVTPKKLETILDESKGAPVILNYWASWCSSCRSSLRMLADLQKKYKDLNLRVISVSVDGTENEIRTALVKHLYYEAGDYYAKTISDTGLTKEIMMVKDSEWLEIVPLYYLLDKNGAVIKRFTGLSSLKKLKIELDKLL